MKPKSIEINRRGSKMVAKSFGFTKERIEALPLPAVGGRTYGYDSKVRGLAVAVSPLGVFLLYRKVQGRPERIIIGRFPDLSIEQARGCAEEMNAAIAQGKNPSAERRALRDEATLGELFDRHVEWAKEQRHSWKNDISMSKHFHTWKLRKLSSIRRSDVVALHEHIGRSAGKYIANRTIELLSAMFNRARQDWGWDGENPAAGIKAFKEQERKRFLQPDELPRFFQALADEPNQDIRDYILVSLFTGARRGNVQGVRWDEINFERATWTIPRTKNDESVTVPLTTPALSILERRKAKATSEYVFPGRGRSGHLEEPKACWKRVLARAGLRDLRLHDLRRTFGAYQACAGTSLPIIGESLGHKSLAATQDGSDAHALS